LLVAIVALEAIEKIIVHAVMVGRQSVSIFQRDFLGLAERLEGFVEIKIRDFLLG